MDSLTGLLGGFADVLTPVNLIYVLVGALIGTAVGVLPGLGSAMAVALLLPITFTIDPLAALVMFAGIYFGGLFGDAIAGILMNTPGNSTAIAGSIEGHLMAKRGRGAQALATSAMGAFIGGMIATILVVFFAPSLADMATKFGPGEYFALALFAFLATSAVVSDSVLKGLAALLIGLVLAMIGTDQVSGSQRFTFGNVALFDGVSIVVITVAMLAVGEVIYVASRIGRPDDRSFTPSTGRPYLSLAEYREALPAWLRGTAFGVPFGVIPAGGAEVPTFLAYGVEKRLDRRRKFPQFGRGAIRGVAAPEAAGNATAGRTNAINSGSTARCVLMALPGTRKESRMLCARDGRGHTGSGQNPGRRPSGRSPSRGAAASFGESRGRATGQSIASSGSSQAIAASASRS